MSTKIYKCYRCKKILDYKPTRITKQIYGAGKYNQYCPVEHYDLCSKCYSIFEEWMERKNLNGRSKEKSKTKIARN